MNYVYVVVELSEDYFIFFEGLRGAFKTEKEATKVAEELATKEEISYFEVHKLAVGKISSEDTEVE